MARTTRTQTEEQEPRLKKPADEAKQLLQARVEIGKDLISQILAISNAETLDTLKKQRSSWTEYNETLLRSLFANPNRILREYRFLPVIGGANQSLPVEIGQLADEVREDIRALESIIDRLPLFEDPAVTVGGSAVAPGSSALRVFVVHGHNEAARLQLVRFLQSTAENFSVQVLSEALNQGRTIIEKFEDEAGAATYAVILLTADDECGPLATKDRRARGRQNVILELGYFIGRLGRKKVAILYEEGVELPSDVLGVAYIPLDSHGGWQMKLARELRGAGHQVDLDKAP